MEFREVWESKQSKLSAADPTERRGDDTIERHDKKTRHDTIQNRGERHYSMWESFFRNATNHHRFLHCISRLVGIAVALEFVGSQLSQHAQDRSATGLGVVIEDQEHRWFWFWLCIGIGIGMGMGIRRLLLIMFLLLILLPRLAEIVVTVEVMISITITISISITIVVFVHR